MGTHPHSSPSNHSVFNPTAFQDLVKPFLQAASYRGLSLHTISYYQFHLIGLERYLNQQDAAVDSASFPSLVHNLLNQMIGQGYSSNSLRGRLNTCRQFYRFSFPTVAWPAQFNSVLRQSIDRPSTITCFTEAEVALVLQQPNRRTFTGFRDYVILLLLLDTGIRLGELSALRVSDLDLSDQLIRISKGKGSKCRHVSIQVYCFKHLRSYLQLRGEQFHENLWIIRNGQPLQRASIIKMVQKHCRGAGFQGSAHTFRRTMAKVFLLSGGDVHALQSILGHSTLEMTRQYVHLLPSDIHSRHESYSPVESLLAYHNQMREERSTIYE